MKQNHDAESICPCCGRHCPIDNLHCQRGKSYFGQEADSEQHYNTLDINGKLVISLRDLSHTMRSLYEGKGSQKRILIILNEVNTITQRELTERLGVQPGSVSEVIAKLENSGLITRILSEADRRTTDITLTEAGKKLADEALAQRNNRHEEMFSCLSDDEKSELLKLLEKINADWVNRYGHIAKKTRHCGKPHHQERRV